MNEKSLPLLNKALADELSAVHQYMYFHFHCDDQGFDLLAELFKRTAIDEMKHIERLADRILFLKGDVEMNPADPVKQIRSIRDMLGEARSMERASMRAYNQWAQACASHADAISKQLFESLVGEEERHYNLFDTELEHIEKFGENYLALHSIERSTGLRT